MPTIHNSASSTNSNVTATIALTGAATYFTDRRVAVHLLAPLLPVSARRNILARLLYSRAGSASRETRRR